LNLFILIHIHPVDIDRITLQEFRRLAIHEPESGVSYCPGVQYFEADDLPGEDSYWVRDLFQDVS
jgi:hypothetical protein